VRGIESNGALQAIVRGITQTCTDLGIDVIVKHVKTMAEFHWFRAEGLQLFQGDLFALAASDQLPTHVAIPSREAA
jgi:EAL domain-containing protein (putative c-di-GMP-specific phosphodiesterase class I)